VADDLDLAPKDGPRKPCLLAVDDDVDNAELIARVAARCGYEAKAISDAEQIPHLLAKWNPEIITIDICMPQTDRLEASLLLQEEGFVGHVIIISGQERELLEIASDLFEARGLKIAGTLSKPVDVALLRDLLASIPLSTRASEKSQAACKVKAHDTAGRDIEVLCDTIEKAQEAYKELYARGYGDVEIQDLQGNRIDRST
jgi:two-component system, chemotaxis family, chemotaxis protein CheY